MRLLFGSARTVMGGSRLNIQPVVPEFADCFTMVGTTGIVLSDGYLEKSALVLGELELNDQRRLPAALWLPAEAGAIFVDAPSLVLDGSGCHAEDRGETNREDFWLVRAFRQPTLPMPTPACAAS